MKNLRDLLDKVYLVYYVVIDCEERCSKKYYYADIVFKNYDSALAYINEGNKIPGSIREYKIVCVPII